MKTSPQKATHKDQQPFVFLIGFMGAGKSAVASGLQKRLSIDRIEMDREIELGEGMTIPEIFSKKGQEYFRDLETGLLKSLETRNGCVVSCGGGAILRPENVRIMKALGRILWLTASPVTIWERVRFSDNRPLLKGRMDPESIRQMMEERRPAYERAADLIIDTDQKSVDQVVEEIIRMIE